MQYHTCKIPIQQKKKKTGPSIRPERRRTGVRNPDYFFMLSIMIISISPRWFAGSR
jgi:hypothetical protein